MTTVCATSSASSASPVRTSAQRCTWARTAVASSAKARSSPPRARAAIASMGSVGSAPAIGIRTRPPPGPPPPPPSPSGSVARGGAGRGGVELLQRLAPARRALGAGLPRDQPLERRAVRHPLRLREGRGDVGGDADALPVAVRVRGLVVRGGDEDAEVRADHLPSPGVGAAARLLADDRRQVVRLQMVRERL